MTAIPDGIELTPFNEDFYSDPYEVYARLRSREPIHQDSVALYENSWTVTDFDNVKWLLTDSRLSVDSRKIGVVRDPRARNSVTDAEPNMMGLDDPEHSRLRRLVQKAFNPARVEGFRPRIEQIVQGRIDQMKDIGSVDIVTAFAKPIPTIAIAEFLGLDSCDHVLFKSWTDSLLKQGYPLPTEAQWNEIVAADEALREYMEAVIAERRLAPKDDLISALALGQSESDRLSEDEVVEMCCLLIGAGNFTTTDLISNSILAVLQHPVEVTQIRTGSTSIEKLIEECLRFDPPSVIVRRFALEDIEIDGYTIRKGSAVNLVVGAANHDPDHFHNPDDFDASLERSRHLSFGRGIHHCLGAPLARLEAQVAVELFVKAFPEARLIDYTRTKTMGFRGCRSLNVAIA